MSDLTEFLLARLADEEAFATTGSMATRRPSATVRREAAEREAKRRIVERATTTWPEDETRWALLILAAVYADHTDYCEEWKP